jgi:pilus assembly protein Flp/PilA
LDQGPVIISLPAINNSNGLPAGAAWWSVAMRRRLVAFLRNESGATAIEYALIAAGIALAILPAIKGVGTPLKSTFQTISSALK